MKATKSALKTHRKKTAASINDEAFADLKQALEDALAFERGERRDLKCMRIQVSGEVKTNRQANRSET